MAELYYRALAHHRHELVFSEKKFCLEGIQKLFDLHKVSKALDHLSYIWSLSSTSKAYISMVGPLGINLSILSFD